MSSMNIWRRNYSLPLRVRIWPRCRWRSELATRERRSEVACLHYNVPSMNFLSSAHLYFFISFVIWKMIRCRGSVSFERKKNKKKNTWHITLELTCHVYRGPVWCQPFWELFCFLSDRFEIWNQSCDSLERYRDDKGTFNMHTHTPTFRLSSSEARIKIAITF